MLWIMAGLAVLAFVGLWDALRNGGALVPVLATVIVWLAYEAWQAHSSGALAVAAGVVLAVAGLLWGVALHIDAMRRYGVIGAHRKVLAAIAARLPTRARTPAGIVEVALLGAALGYWCNGRCWGCGRCCWCMGWSGR